MVMEELQEATKLYLSCSNRIETAARRQRVLHSDARGDMEEAALAIIETARERLALSNSVLSFNSNHYTSPPAHTVSAAQDPSLQRLLFLDTSTTFCSPTRGNKWRERLRLKSVIVSPQTDTELAPKVAVPAESPREDTLREFQNRIRRRTVSHSKIRSPQLTPNILRGASSKKRKLSHIRHSPAYSKKSSPRSSSKVATKSVAVTSGAGSSAASSNPPIRLIPAATKKRSDFWVPLPWAP
ncbi:hypothetical protein Bca52824_084501 [Brassica carinata]|uniref:Uncharacterized protein n=1 Tax=Brassica carinata TaxID=52824 RepID=A0A8X7PNI5_BRACI|nr:hypothetical protein Bca52824_084501 [Brassica carinata]